MTKTIEQRGELRFAAPPDSLSGEASHRFLVTVDGTPVRYTVDRKASELRVDMPPPRPFHQTADGADSREVKVQSENGDEIADVKVREISGDPHLVAVLTAGLITTVVCLLVMFCARVDYRIWINEVRVGMLSAFFVDPQTMTYSLSRFQFFTWTAAAVFAYSYLAVCVVFQHSNKIPDVPVELAELFAISTGTALGATAITSKKGSEGSGQMVPALSDLLTAGGVVAVDKAQFFIWTILGAGSFVACVASLPPLQAQTLPHIPQGLLALSGISAAGYLGGKLSRKPGPVISELSMTSLEEAVAVADTRTIIIRGQNLSVDATIEIDKTRVLSTYLKPDETGRQAPVVIDPGDDRSQPNLVKGMSLPVRNALIPAPLQAVAGKWFQPGEHQLVLINPDGQMAIGKWFIPK